MPRKKPITLAQVDKARASFLCLLRDVKGRREKERHGQNLRRAISARAKWLRLKLAYEAQEFTPANDKPQTAKAAPRAAGTPSGVIVDGVPENFHGVRIHKGNTPAGGLNVTAILEGLVFSARVKGLPLDLEDVEGRIRRAIFEERRRICSGRWIE